MAMIVKDLRLSVISFTYPMRTLITHSDVVDSLILIILEEGSLSQVIGEIAMAWPLHHVMDTCCPATGCYRHPICTSLLLRLVG